MRSGRAGDSTIEEPLDAAEEAPAAEATPRLLVVFSQGAPTLVRLALARGYCELGRAELAAHHVEDARASRRHFAVEWGAESLRIHDLGSTNGLFVNGARITEPWVVPAHGVATLRLGRTILLVAHPSARLEPVRPSVSNEVVVGAALQAVHRRVVALGRTGQAVLLRGESGVGKEVAARLYHRAGARAAGPFVAVNCAAVPRELAERLFFGTTKGAYSGAVAAQGYLQAAHRGTLFLDEVAELDLSVQAKLLRVIDTHEVVPLGATRPEQVDLGICAATLRDLREAVTAGAFREDLYYRIGRPEIRLPALRERIEEIPFLVDRITREVGATAGVSLVEACLLRPWPGNVRELGAEVRAASALALAASVAEVSSDFLDEHAGRPVRAPHRPGLAVDRPPRAEPQPLARSSADHPAVAARATDAPGLDAIVRSASVALGLAHKTVRKLLAGEQLQALAERLHGADPDTALALLRGAAADALGALLKDASYNRSLVAASLGTSRTTLLKLSEALELPRAESLAPEAIERALTDAGGDAAAAAHALRVSPSALKKRRASRQ